jgi:hypothetical protein
MGFAFWSRTNTGLKMAYNLFIYCHEHYRDCCFQWVKIVLTVSGIVFVLPLAFRPKAILVDKGLSFGSTAGGADVLQHVVWAVAAASGVL